MWNLWKGKSEKKQEEIKRKEKQGEAEMFSEIVKELDRDTSKEVIRIRLNKKPVSLTGSKFGGVPYLPFEGEVPCDAQGRQMRLLAQLRLEELPENHIYPPEGMLQFWALDDDCTGLDFENPVSQSGSRILYYKKIDETVTEEQVLERYHPYCEGESYFPIQTIFGLEFSLETEGISTEDFQFDERFVQCWNRKFPEKKINSYMDLSDDLSEMLSDQRSGFGHKIGGYPAFTQEDPRDMENGYGAYLILLLQIDSVGIGEDEIMWGDSGICNFFIREEDLLKLDFGRVMYNWDCY